MPKIEAGLPNGSEVGAPPGAAAAAAAAVAAATTQVKAEPSIELGGAQGLKMDQVFENQRHHNTLYKKVNRFST